MRHINNPSLIIQLAAVRRHEDTFKYIKNPSEEVQLEAVKQNEFLIAHINKPSEKVQLEAIKKNILVIQYIEWPSKAVQLYVATNIRNNDFDFFMQYSRKRINYSKALNLLYMKAPNEYKEQIKSHPNYKSDAQLILDSLKEN